MEISQKRNDRNNHVSAASTAQDNFIVFSAVQKKFRQQ